MWDRSAPHDRRECLFGGRGAVLVWNLSPEGGAAPAQLEAPFGAILACELEGGASVGEHVQPQFAEVVIGLEGRGLARVAGAPSPLQPGAVIHVPLGHTLALENASANQSLRYLIIKAG